MINKKGKAIFIVVLVLIFLLVVGVIIYFVISKGNKRILPADVCVYDNEKYITCGTAFVLVSEGVEYPLVANEPFYFPQGDNNLIGLLDKTKSENDGAFLLFLKEGEHTINEETSRRAVGSFITQN